MQRIGCSFGVLEYKTHSIPTMGVSNSDSDLEPIKLVEEMAKEYNNHYCYFFHLFILLKNK
jgi:hypothetical protein